MCVVSETLYVMGKDVFVQRVFAMSVIVRVISGRIKKSGPRRAPFDA